MAWPPGIDRNVTKRTIELSTTSISSCLYSHTYILETHYLQQSVSEVKQLGPCTSPQHHHIKTCAPTELPYVHAMAPPSNAQKGSKAGKLSGAPRDGRHSRSRNTTPSSIGGVGSLPTAMELDNESKYLELTMDPFPQTTYESLIDPSIGSTIPDSKAIDAIIATLDDLLKVAEERGIACDRGMRELAKKRKEQVEDERLAVEQNDRDAEEMRRHAGGASSKFKKKSGGKREENERPLTHGAHGLPPQDGSHLGKLLSHIRAVIFF